MKLSEFKSTLSGLTSIQFKLPNSELVPKHFHVTEIGKITKEFVDCGGTLRKESVVNFQLWNANDYNHRLHPEKISNIITEAEKTLSLEDDEVEVEYQGETIGKFGLELEGNTFLLTTKRTDCLDSESCGIPAAKSKVSLSNLSNAKSCTSGGSCC